MAPGGVVGKIRVREAVRGMPNRTLHVSNGKKKMQICPGFDVATAVPDSSWGAIFQFRTRKGRLFTGSDEMGGCNFFGRRYEQAAAGERWRWTGGAGCRSARSLPAPCVILGFFSLSLSLYRATAQSKETESNDTNHTPCMSVTMHSPTRAQSKVKTHDVKTPSCPHHQYVHHTSGSQAARHLVAALSICSMHAVQCSVYARCAVRVLSRDYLHVQYSSVCVAHIKGQAIPYHT